MDSQIRDRPALTEHRDGISFAEITNTIRRSWGSAVPERRGARWRRASVGGGGAPRPWGAAPSEWGEDPRGPLSTSRRRGHPTGGGRASGGAPGFLALRGGAAGFGGARARHAGQVLGEMLPRVGRARRRKGREVGDGSLGQAGT